MEYLNDLIDDCHIAAAVGDVLDAAEGGDDDADEGGDCMS